MTDAEKQLIEEVSNKYAAFAAIEEGDPENLWRFFDEVIDGVNGLRFDAAAKEFPMETLETPEPFVGRPVDPVFKAALTSAVKAFIQHEYDNLCESFKTSGLLKEGGYEYQNSTPPVVEGEKYPTHANIGSGAELTITAPPPPVES